MPSADNHHSGYSVLVAVRDASDLPLIGLACRLARVREGGVCVFTASIADAQPAWLKLPDSCADVRLRW